jgi:phenylacetate-CoA ligase
MYSKMIKNIFFPLVQMNLPKDDRYITHMRLLDKTQWWSTSELEQFQLKRLKKLLHHANDNAPFYHKMFKKYNFDPESVRNVNDLRKLPILTKDIINKNFNDIKAINYSKNKFIPTSTSGSTGTPMKFYIDKKWDACTMAAAFRVWEWAGYNLGDKMVYLWGAPSDIHDSRPIDKIRNYMLRTINLNAFNLTDENMGEYTKILNTFKPKIINTYASVIFLFSEYLKKEGIDYIKPYAILTTADMLYPHQRETIVDVFDCDVFDYYSGRDTTLMAAECPEHNGYHLSIENAVVEFIQDNEPVSNGETGNIIITDLCNYTMPFIRYEIGDLGTPSDEKCSCKRNLPLMKSLKGRIFDFIITPDGKHIPGEYFHYIIIDHKIHGIKEFQILQNSINKLTVFIVKDTSEKTDDSNRFISIIKNKIGENVEIELVYTSSIQRTKSGKLRHVISKVNQSNSTSAKYQFGD